MAWFYIILENRKTNELSLLCSVRKEIVVQKNKLDYFSLSDIPKYYDVKKYSDTHIIHICLERDYNTQGWFNV